MIFNYKNKVGLPYKYYGIIPTGFFECPKSPSCKSGMFMSAWDMGAGKYKEFCSDTITDVLGDLSLIDALLDPSSGYYFWNGDLSRTGKEALFEDLLDEIKKATDITVQNQLVLEWLKNNISAETTPIAGPSTDIEHEAYTVTIDGIPVYFDEINDAAVALARELFVGNPLPDTLKNMVVGIQIVAEDARGGADVVGMSADGFVTIFGDREVDTGIVAHEIAHDFATSKWGDMFPAADSDYQAAIDSGEPPVSEYAKKNTGEDFAEAVRMYVDDPEQLKMDYPERYQVIDRLMKDDSYGG